MIAVVVGKKAEAAALGCCWSCEEIEEGAEDVNGPSSSHCERWTNDAICR